MSAPEAVAEELAEQAPTVVDKADEVAADNESAQEMVADNLAEKAQQAANSPATPQNDVQQQHTAAPKENKSMAQKFQEGAQAAANYVMNGSKAEQARQKRIHDIQKDMMKDPKDQKNPEACKRQQQLQQRADDRVESALNKPSSGDWASVSDNAMEVLSAVQNKHKVYGGADTIFGRAGAALSSIKDSSTVGPLLKGGKAALTAPYKAVKKITEMAKSQGMTPEEMLVKKCKEEGMSPEQTQQKLDEWKLAQQQAKGVTQLAEAGLEQQASATTPEAETPTVQAALDNTEEDELDVTTPGLGNPGASSTN